MDLVFSYFKMPWFLVISQGETTSIHGLTLPLSKSASRFTHFWCPINGIPLDFPLVICSLHEWEEKPFSLSWWFTLLPMYRTNCQKGQIGNCAILQGRPHAELSEEQKRPWTSYFFPNCKQGGVLRQYFPNFSHSHSSFTTFAISACHL